MDIQPPLVNRALFLLDPNPLSGGRGSEGSPVIGLNARTTCQAERQCGSFKTEWNTLAMSHRGKRWVGGASWTPEERDPQGGRMLL